MLPLPMEAYQAADEAASRVDAVDKAAPHIIGATLRFAAGRTQSTLTYLSRHLTTLFILMAMLAVGLEVQPDHRWLLGSAAFLLVFRTATEELLLKRLLRRSVLFATKKPDYWR